jgi:3'-phosphoadenosine 5'-phosphosulfate sulfotransferase
MKAQIEKYKINGKVYCWKYKDNERNYSGWNFTVDLKASRNLSELLDLMSLCEWSSKKKIQIEMPTSSQLTVPNNQGGRAKWKTSSKITLNSKKTEPENHWKIREMGDEIEIQFGKAKLTEFQNAIKEIPNGKSDYAIADQDDENILHFWWNLEK